MITVLIYHNPLVQLYQIDQEYKDRFPKVLIEKKLDERFLKVIKKKRSEKWIRIECRERESSDISARIIASEKRIISGGLSPPPNLLLLKA
jgi:hypothetical protein